MLFRQYTDPKLAQYASGARSAAASAFLAREGYDVAYVNGAFCDYAGAHEVATGSHETVKA